MQENSTWKTIKELLSVVSLLVLTFCVWSAVVDLTNRVEQIDIESERRFKSLEETILEQVSPKWTEDANSLMQRLQSLPKPQQSE